MIPRVYAAINAVASALAKHGIAKDRFNLDDDYAYRSIDDILIRLSPLLAEHRLCVLPRVLERSVSERQGLAGELLLSVSVLVAYDLVSVEDGSTHTIEVSGEALDAGDKGTAKAMQSAYKYAMIQAFAIPVSGSEDADARSPQLKQPEIPAEPVQGWEQWCEDIAEMIASCESAEAVQRVQQAYRATFAALQRERAALYASLGKTMAQRRAELEGRGPVEAGHRVPDSDRASRKATVRQPAEDAQKPSPAKRRRPAAAGKHRKGLAAEAARVEVFRHQQADTSEGVLADV